MGIGRVRLVPRGSAIGIESQEIDDAQLVDLTEPTSHERLMLTDYGAWEFQYNDRLGDRAVRLEFDGVVLSRIHVRWYPPSSYFFGPGMTILICLSRRLSMQVASATSK